MEKYLKYKIKYMRSIKTYNKPGITIRVGTKEFELCFSFKLEGLPEYIFIKIKNITDSVVFYVYRSNSEVNVYRFVMWPIDNKDILSKGRNYITTTFIHYDLQLEIKKQFTKIKMLQEDEIRRLYRDELRNFYNTPEEFINEINMEDRLFQDEFWSEFKKCSQSTCFIKGQNPVLNLYKSDNHLIKICIKKVIDDKISSISDPEIIFDLNLIKATIEIFDTETYEPESLDDKIIKMRAQIVFDSLSEMMKNTFEVNESTVTELDKYEYTICGKKIKGQFFSVEIDRISNSNIIGQYLCIYNKYTLEETEYKCIVNILPRINNPITRLGLYSKYVDTGVLIGKPFEYKSQFNYNHEIQNHYYVFIGDLLTNVYPMNFQKTY